MAPDRGGAVEPDGPDGPNGYYEETIFGTSTWHNDLGPDLHGAAARRKATEVFGPEGPHDGITGEPGFYGKWDDGSGSDPNDAPEPGSTDPYDGARFQDPNAEEDERGPDGDRMPRVEDLPSYTLIGQILKRFG